MKKVPILIDFDGIIRLGNSIAGDAGNFLDFLDKNKLPFFIISNSTQYTGNDIKKFLNVNGIGTEAMAMTTIDATVKYLDLLKLKIAVYCKEEMKKYFSEYITIDKPDAVVIGDLEEDWTYEILNEIFRKVLNGASMIAMQKNKFWQPAGKELSLDAGSFIAALEYATSKKALLIGKPSSIYFNTALESMGYEKGQEFIMIGDDINSDIQGAQDLGGTGILVFTGKTKKNYDRSSLPSADYQCDNLTEAVKTIRNILGR